MSWTLSSFYRSKEWEKFRQVVINSRLDEKGDTIDEVTGKPIVNRYDIILHHKTPLTESNVNDYDVSLNPDNIMIVSHKTHNDIHKRFGAVYTRHVYIVWGSPCAGKTTYVMDNALEEDLIVDIDRIYQAIGTERSNRLYENVMAVYNLLVDQVKTRRGKWINAWVMRTLPLPMERERLATMLNAELIHIDTPEGVCMARAEGVRKDWVKEYWRKYAE